MNTPFNRRDFLATGMQYLGTGLVLACGSNFLGAKLFGTLDEALAADAATGVFSPNVFIIIKSDDSIELVCHRTEIGQGARTSVAILLAEELDVSLDKIKLTQGEGDAKFGDQNTDGSTTVRKNWHVLRQAGAAAREMLIAAAAKTWSVPIAQLSTDNGFVVDSKSKKRASFGSLAATASKLPVPKTPTLKSKTKFKLIGKSVASLDLESMTHGKAVYGIDVQLPDMLYASIERSPSIDAAPTSYDEAAAMSVAGVKKIVPIAFLPQSVNCKAGVAVVADNTWAANRGREKLNIKWKLGSAPRYSSDEYRKKLEHWLKGADIVFRNDGDADKVLASSKVKHSFSFHTPYACQSPMEPLVATAWVQDNKCEIWAPTQDPQRAREAAAGFLKMPLENVRVNVTLAGGGFGRKSQPDFVLEAVQVSKALKAPVKVTWTREDEIRHGFYHSESLQKIDLSVDEKGMIDAWRHVSVFPTLFTVFNPKADQPSEPEISMGASQLPYRIPNVRVLSAKGIDADVRVGWLRSVCHVFHSFAINTAINETAATLKKDPIDYRLALLGAPRIVDPKSDAPFKQDTKRMMEVVKRVRQDAGWGKKKLSPGRVQGFANHYSFFSYVAMIVEASIVDGKPKVHDVYCAVDCGPVVNLDAVKAQIEGGIAYGLSLTFHSKITTKDGAVVQSNFDNYPVIRTEEMPNVHVSLIQSDSDPTGIGEPPTPPVAPAVAHAVAQLRKTPVRSLPIV